MRDKSEAPETATTGDAYTEFLLQNLAQATSRIADAAKRSARTIEDIRLLPVTKHVSAEHLRVLAEAGYRQMAESQVQELRQKSEALEDLSIDWVLIGHLQRNKAAQASRIISEVQSINSLRIAEALSRNLAANDKRIPALLQVNVSGETTKSGFAPEDVEETLAKMLELPGLQIEGLMTMAPHSDDEDEVRRTFAGLRELRDRLAPRFEPDLRLTQLSMGMSGDFEIAIEEGATTVRLGSVLFGERDY